MFFPFPKDRTNPHEAFIRKIEQGQLPLEREMIMPQDLMEAPQLEKIYEN